MLCQIVRTGSLDAPLGVAQSFPRNLPFLHRERAILVKNLVPDTLEIFPQMQIRLLVDQISAASNFRPIWVEVKSDLAP